MPWRVTVDSTHNKIYVPDVCGAGGVTVIDGQTLGTQFVATQITPLRIAVNETTNKIYVVNNCGSDNNCRSAGSVTVIDGNTLNTQTVAVGFYPVVPQGLFGYLTLWPDGENQPGVSTLDAIDGAITSNMAIVPTTNGSIDAYASGLTQLILDISSYFAP